MAVSIKFIADIASWVNGLGKSEDAVEDNEAALEDLMKQAIELGRAAGKTTDEIARDFSQAFGVPLDRAKSAVDEVTGATEDLGKAADDAGDEIATGIDGGAKDAGSSMTELGSIAKDVLEGDFTGATESAVSALGLLGPAGVAAGALVGLAIGAVTSSFEENKRKQEELAEAASQWATAYEGAAGRVVDASYTVGEILAITTDPERFAEAQKAAEEWGVGVETAVGALAGDATALAVAQDGLADRTQKANDAMSEAERNVGKLGDQYSSLPEDIQDGQARMDMLTDSMAEGARQAQIGATALYNYATATGTATGETDDLGNAIIKLPDGKEIVVDAETKTAYRDIDAIEKKKLSDKTTTVKVKVDASAWNSFRPQQKTATIGGIPSESWVSGKRQKL